MKNNKFNFQTLTRSLASFIIPSKTIAIISRISLRIRLTSNTCIQITASFTFDGTLFFFF
jgi:hypothetical protein